MLKTIWNAAIMREEELEIALKVVIVGNGGKYRCIDFYFVSFQSYSYNTSLCFSPGVGKSSMIQRYCKGIYTRDYKKTIGVDFLERQIE